MSIRKKVSEIDLNKIKDVFRKYIKFILCRLRKFFSTKFFSKGQMLVFCFIIVSGSFLYQDVVKFGFFIFFILVTWLTGTFGSKYIKKVLERAEHIIENPFIPIDKKYVEAVDAVHKSCDYLGVVMDRYNLQQGTAPYLKDLKQKAGGETKE